jgi:hypothetical protein
MVKIRRHRSLASLPACTVVGIKKENRSNSPVDPRRRHTSGRHGELSFEIPSHCAEVHTRLRNPSQKQGEMAEETVSRRPEIYLRI